MKGFPPLIKVLLLTSLMLTIGRGLTLPFLAIFLSQQRGMAPEHVGLALGAGLSLAIVFSLYGGYLVDKFNKRRLIICAMTCFSGCFLLLPLTPSIMLIVVLIALINSAWSLFTITLKATFSEWLPVDDRIKAFSLNYTLINVGWAIGPPLSVAIAVTYPLAPFLLAGGLGLSTTLVLLKLLSSYGPPPAHLNAEVTAPAIPKPDFRQTLGILRRDKRLLWFTLGGTLGSLVCSQFTSCISQYLMVAFDAAFAYKVVGIILPVNAVIVVTLQYLVSRHISQAKLMSWLVVGTMFFLLGLGGIAMAGNSLPVWVAAVAIFSLGEIIIIPVEYLFIDFIAPSHLKGSYYGMQNLSNLGGAANPLLTGLCLSYAPPVTVFVMLLLATLISMGLYYRGHRLTQQTLAEG